MKNEVKVVAERTETTPPGNVRKDFSSLLDQYADYQKVRKSYYRLGGLGSGVLSIILIVAGISYRQDVSSPSISASEQRRDQSTIEQAMGPWPQKRIEWTSVASAFAAEETKVVLSSGKSARSSKPSSEEVGSPELVAYNERSEQSKEQNSPAAPVEGFQNLYDYFHMHLSYPQEVVADSIEGVVKVGFLVNPDSSISDLKVLQSLGTILDNEALRLVENMPGWKPAVENGVVISSSFIIPVRFNIKDHE